MPQTPSYTEIFLLEFARWYFSLLILYENRINVLKQYTRTNNIDIYGDDICMAGKLCLIVCNLNSKLIQ